LGNTDPFVVFPVYFYVNSVDGIAITQDLGPVIQNITEAGVCNHSCMACPAGFWCDCGLMCYCVDGGSGGGGGSPYPSKIE
jgi:hypothetical protein